jgi:hypothetical protein
MTNRVPLWVAVAGCVGSVFLGMAAVQMSPARAQAQAEKKPGAEEPPTLTEYPYLPNRFGEPYIPSFAEWQALQVTALGASTTRITQEFQRQHLTCFATPKGIMMTLDLLPDASWKHYAGAGKFSAPADQVKPDLQKAIDTTMKLVRSFFPEAQNKDVSVRLYINSESVGKWEAGKLLLNGEK